ncbi:MAG: adenylate/guanylate cyclase domain-containing protein [Actinomycetota bacterium]
MEIPRTHYATTREGSSIAYQVFGSGPHDLVYSPGWVTNIEVLWEWPGVEKVFRRLGQRCRVVLYDKQGTGLSDRVATTPSLEARMDDIQAVIDACGMEQAALLGPTQGAAVSALFAATYPERVTAFLPYGPFARTMWAPDWPFGASDAHSDWERHLTADEWGTEEWALRFCVDWGAESLRGDPTFLRWLAKMMRFAATPTAAAAFNAAFDETDVRHVLPSIAAPTLLLYRANQDEREEIEATAALIPMARTVELPADHWSPYLGDPEPMAQEIERTLDGIQEQESELDRVLATVLFTDIVDSTVQGAAMGDRAWREVRGRHDAIARANFLRYRGKEIKTMGDGFLATFDGPARAVRCAQAIVAGMAPLGIEIRAGLHTGEVALDGEDVAGIGVAIGARVGAKANASEVLVSQTVKDLVGGSGLAFEDAGEHELKGVPDRWRLYRVVA